MSVSPGVRANFPEWICKTGEGRKNFIYRDVKGLETTGVGNLVSPIELALVLPWRNDDGELASEDDVRSNWETVHAMPFGLAYAAERFQLHGGVHLDEDDIDRLVCMKVDQFAGWLEVHYFPDLGAYPDQVQLVLLAMAWAMGPDFPKKFPKFTRAILARAWVTAAQECIIPELGMDPKGHNVANVKLLMAAHG